jgi:hypothetical protein
MFKLVNGTLINLPHPRSLPETSQKQRKAEAMHGRPRPCLDVALAIAIACRVGQDFSA